MVSSGSALKLRTNGQEESVGLVFNSDLPENGITITHVHVLSCQNKSR